MFTLTVDHADRQIHIHMSGFFTVAEVDDLRRQEQSLAESTGWHVGGFDALITSSQDCVQSPEVVEAIRRSLTEARYKARRIAIVGASALTQMQTKRIIQGGRARIFAGLDDAKAWLAEPDDDPAPGSAPA